MSQSVARHGRALPWSVHPASSHATLPASFGLSSYPRFLSRQDLRTLRLAAVQHIVPLHDRSRFAYIAHHRSRPEHRALAGFGVLVPTAAAAGLPHRPSQAFSQLFHKALLRFSFHFHYFAAALAHQAEATHHVADLRFAHQDHGVVPQSGVGPKEDKKVGKAADSNTQIGADAVFPRFMNINSVAADHARVMQRFGGAEA